MSDPRFSRLKSDPRFRRIRNKDSKVVVDDRFKGLFDDTKGSKKHQKSKNRVDKYGRKLSESQEQDNLRRFYRLENEEDDGISRPQTKRDLARGEILLESSDEEDNVAGPAGDESGDDGVVVLGHDATRPISLLSKESDELEVDLDEDILADLNKEAAEYNKEHDTNNDVPEAQHTRRLAVVNLDWEHVRATHLFKIFSSYLTSNPSTQPTTSDNKGAKVVGRPAHGKVISVRVYPSEFGAERLAKEEREGPPTEVFRKSADNSADSDPEDAEDYNEEALRKYQLERLRYYYAIVECDRVKTASFLYSELEGTELERSANVFDLSFVPDDMTFQDKFRDEAKEDVNVSYKPVEFVTDALRHSKVKLTWDDDDPERTLITRRALTRKEIEENDFKAYIASSESESENADAPPTERNKANRDKLRALLLSGENEDLPEGWGAKDDGGDTDMEITFTPGLSETKKDGEETTLEKYQRKMKEKKKKRKEELQSKKGEKTKTPIEDDFFANESGSDESELEDETTDSAGRHPTSSAAELALVAVSDNPNSEPQHFDMKAVLKAEKAKGKKRRPKKSKDEHDKELQQDFVIDVQDERFKAVHDDPSYAIDPSNPHFKKTKSMSALLEERSKRHRTSQRKREKMSSDTPPNEVTPNLKNLVERVKRKSAIADSSVGKRRKL